MRTRPAAGACGYFPTGIGWYRKAFRLPAGARGREAWLEFDGVYMNSDVWINGVHLGKRPYGYISFAYDITAAPRAWRERGRRAGGQLARSPTPAGTRGAASTATSG